MLNSRLAQESPATKLQKALVKARDQVVLNPDDLPGSWYNILADLPGDFPRPKDPDEGPSRLEFLSKVLLKHCLQQETSTDKWISIPSDVQDLYRQAGRPRPSTVHDGSKNISKPLPGSTTRGRISLPPGRIRSILLSLRPTMRQKRALSVSRLRLVRASGGQLWPTLRVFRV